MHCFFCSDIPQCGGNACLDQRDAKHLFRTLRARPGEKIELTDGLGVFAVAEIMADNTLSVCERETYEKSGRKLELFIAPPRKQKMDALLKQCAEIGIDRIVPMLCERSVSTPEKESVLEHWQQILLEGCKQSKNPFMPEISLPVSFPEALRAARDCRCFYGSPRDGIGPGEIETDKRNFAWFIGPEGGFTPEEEGLMDEQGFSRLRLTPWVLRVETAAICGAMILKLK